MKRQHNKFKNSNYISLIICAFGIALNLLLNTAFSAFDLSVSLDVTGTVAAAVLGGYLPGVLVAFISNMIRSVYDPYSLYFGMTDILIAVLAAWYAKRGRTGKASGILSMIAFFTLISCAVGTLLPYFIEGIDAENAALSRYLNRKCNIGSGASNILSNFIINLADKSVSVIIALIIVQFVPKSIRRRSGLTWWLQSPVPENDMKKTGKSRVISLRDKTMLLLALSMTTVAVLAMAVCMNIYHESNINDHTELAQGMAKLAAGDIDGDKIDVFLETRGNAAGYRETEEQLTEILNSSPDIEYLYVYKINDDGCRVIYDLGKDGEPGDEIGSVIPLDDGLGDSLPALLRGEEVDPVITNDEYGRLLTAYQPVYDSEGECVCYVGADVDMAQLIADERSFLVKMSAAFLSFFIVFVVLGIWLTQYHIIYPMKTITKYVDEFCSAGASQDQLDDFIKQFRKLGIHTGDEIEKLYNALCHMILNQAEQTRSIRRLSDATTKMQDGLIITMADLVESRDSDTGAHVQKTAAYVRIIAEGLKKKGYYAEKITPKFMSDVVRSAPLHDVGKINIPDEVLNKPGKLTDEEYEIMKTHTTAGKKIMEHAIGTVEGDSYLKEARNMAAYHHERWDGKGYPEHLHGSVIPLSARIMAVADVFDALTSPRVYKPAFPIEKALAIIEEGRGTQFDPLCVEVFMDSLPEVKEVLRKYNQYS